MKKNIDSENCVFRVSSQLITLIFSQFFFLKDKRK